MRRIYRRVVIESPFGHPTKEGQDENLRYLRACMRDCLDRGEAPFASHGLYTQPDVLNDWDPQEREKGIQAGFEWRLVAQATIVYADRGITQGMRAGIRKATELQSGGVFDHYVEYRFLGGEWSALGGPEEIRKHLEGLLDEHQSKHRHLALVTGPAPSPRQMHVMPTPAELSMEGVARRTPDGRVVTSIQDELQPKTVESPTGPSGSEEPSSEQCCRACEHRRRHHGRAGTSACWSCSCVSFVEPDYYDRMSDVVEKYPPGFGVPERKEKRPEEDLLPPEAMSTRTKAMFEGEFGGGRGFDYSDSGKSDPLAPVTPENQHEVMTLDEVKEALKQGSDERAEAEKTIKRPPRH